ncbi:Os11g0311100, partial [Oryza sativa Japonica Group]
LSLSTLSRHTTIHSPLLSSPLLSSPLRLTPPLTAYRAASVSAAARLGSGGSAADSAGIRLRLFTAASEPGQVSLPFPHLPSHLSSLGADSGRSSCRRAVAAAAPGGSCAEGGGGGGGGSPPSSQIRWRRRRLPSRPCTSRASPPRPCSSRSTSARGFSSLSHARSSSVVVEGWTRGFFFFLFAGTLIKLVYTASCGGGGAELRFAKFERRRLQECFDFVRAQGLVPPHRFPSVASPPWRRSGGTRLWHGHLLPPPPLRAAAGST